MSAPGWIKIHRALLDHWCATEPDALAVWVRLLCEANFEDRKANVYGQLVEVKRGQVVYGRKEFSKRSGVSEMKLRRIISMLERDGMIIQHKKSKFTLISIACYDKYQEDNQQTTSKQPANNQQTTTPKEVKNLRSKEVTNGEPLRDSAAPSTGDEVNQKRERVPYQQIVDSYHEMLPEMPAIVELSESRKAKIRTLWHKHGFNIDRWNSYLGHIKSNCRWMMGGRQRSDGSMWKPKNLDFLITEKCYLGVREGTYNDDAN